MNRVYLTCRIISVSDICFDYYRKIKPYCILSVVDLDNELNVFDIVVYDKMYIDFVDKLTKDTMAFVVGSIFLIENKSIIYAQEIYFC